MVTQKYTSEQLDEKLQKDAEEQEKNREKNSAFVSLMDGQSIKGMFTGEIVESITHYLQDEKKSVNCTNDEFCKYCLADNKQNKKYYQNFITFNEEEGKYVAKVFGLSPKFRRNLNEALMLSEVNLEGSVVAVKRTGQKIETDYHFQVIKQMELPEVELLDLVKIVSH